MLAPIIVSDLEGTLSSATMWRGILAWIRIHHPSPAARRFVVLRLPQVVLAGIGVLDKEAFRGRWMRDLARLLRGLPAAELAVMGEWVVETVLWPARRQVAIDALSSALRDARVGDPLAEIVLATGGYQQVGDAFAARVGAAIALGTPLEVRDGVVSGALAAPTLSGERKAAAVRARAAGGEILMAFGDTEADVPLLELAHRAIAVAPDRALRRQAVRRGWQILEADQARS